MSASYGWIIDQDFIDDNRDDAGTTGPSGISKALEDDLAAGKGEKFRLFDDDDVLYYEGRLVGDYVGFEPMDDYGTPNAGCTITKVLQGGEWVLL